MDKMIYKKEERVFLVDNFARLQNAKLVQRKFRQRYNKKTAPGDTTIKNMY